MAMAELVGRRGRRQTSILIWDLYKGAQNIRAMHSSRKRGKIIPEGVIGNEVNKLQIAVPSTKMYETRNAVQIYVLDRTFSAPETEEASRLVLFFLVPRTVAAQLLLAFSSCFRCVNKGTDWGASRCFVQALQAGILIHTISIER
jgi:hypothetical protein